MECINCPERAAVDEVYCPRCLAASEARRRAIGAAEEAENIRQSRKGMDE